MSQTGKPTHRPPFSRHFHKTSQLHGNPRGYFQNAITTIYESNMSTRFVSNIQYSTFAKHPTNGNGHITLLCTLIDAFNILECIIFMYFYKFNKMELFRLFYYLCKFIICSEFKLFVFEL